MIAPKHAHAAETAAVVCKHCSPDGRNEHAVQCCATSSRGFICTREKNHPGKHAACGVPASMHPIEIWGK